MRGRERVELAAYLRHEGELVGWARGLERWGKEVCVRAAIAAARAVLPGWEEQQDGKFRAHKRGEMDPRPRQAIEAAEAWVLCPCDEHREECGRRGTTQTAGQLVAFSIGVPGARPDEIQRTLPVVLAAAVEIAGEQAVRDAIKAELIPWALGSVDPIRGREPKQDYGPEQNA